MHFSSSTVLQEGTVRRSGQWGNPSPRVRKSFGGWNERSSETFCRYIKCSPVVPHAHIISIFVRTTALSRLSNVSRFAPTPYPITATFPYPPHTHTQYVEIGFYVDISQESRCNIEIKIRAHFSFISLSTPSQSVSQKRFHQCVNNKKKLSLRYPLPTFGSFSFSRHPSDSGSIRYFKN